jgi:hypothetical protein
LTESGLTGRKNLVLAKQFREALEDLKVEPAGILPGENVNRYPDTVDPAQRLLELERRAAPKELPLPRKLDEKKTK